MGFTLLELLAVLLIGGLLMSFMLPNISAMRSRILQHHAERIVAKVDFGRQRAVVTGIPHRLVIDLDKGSYALEWMGSTEKKQPGVTTQNSELQPVPKKAVELHAPPQTEKQFAPLPGLLGRVESLSDGVRFKEIETPGGWIDSDATFVTFERDGTASFATIVLDDLDGRKKTLKIQPLADTVRIFHEDL